VKDVENKEHDGGGGGTGKQPLHGHTHKNTHVVLANRNTPHGDHATWSSPTLQATSRYCSRGMCSREVTLDSMSQTHTLDLLWEATARNLEDHRWRRGGGIRKELMGEETSVWVGAGLGRGGDKGQRCQPQSAKPHLPQGDHAMDATDAKPVGSSTRVAGVEAPGRRRCSWPSEGVGALGGGGRERRG
jgi:hypothetical protein